MAVQDVDLTVEQGQMACIIGPNGAGKSTMPEWRWQIDYI